MCVSAAAAPLDGVGGVDGWFLLVFERGGEVDAFFVVSFGVACFASGRGRRCMQTDHCAIM